MPTKLLLPFWLIAITAVSANAAEEWGTLSMRFVYDGQPPEQQVIKPDKDVETCAKQKLLDPSLIVNVNDRGVANVVVWLVTEKGEPAPAVHPDYEKSANSDVPISTTDCQFTPHVVLVRTTQTLVFKFGDAIGHHPKCEVQGGLFGGLIPTGREQRQRFREPESGPSPISCAIHGWMSAWLVIHDHPYMAVSDEHGKLAISNLPVGKRTFVVWHERSKVLKEVKRNGELVPWPRGRLTVEIKPGNNGLGEILISPESLKRP